MLKAGQTFVAKTYELAIVKRQIVMFGAALIGLLSGTGITMHYSVTALIVIPAVIGFFLIKVLQAKRPDLWWR